MRTLQLIRENNLNFPFQQLKTISSVSLNIRSSFTFFEKNGFSLLSKLITLCSLIHSSCKKVVTGGYLCNRVIWISPILKTIGMINYLFSMQNYAFMKNYGYKDCAILWRNVCEKHEIDVYAMIRMMLAKKASK